MFGYLLGEAESDLVSCCKVDLLVEKNGKILLLEKVPIVGQGFYELPSGVIKQQESLQQAIQRILVEITSLVLKRVVKFLTYKDSLTTDGKERAFYFIVEANDPEDIALSKHHGYGWVEPKEAPGYPIKEDLREILDLHMKIIGQL